MEGLQQTNIRAFMFIILMILMTSHTVDSQDCTKCNIAIRNGYYSANCAKRNFTKVPSCLYKSIRTLNLTNNKIRHVKNNAFIQYHSLMELYLSNNSVSRVFGNAFDDLKGLTFLDLSSNELTEVPTNALRSPRSLLVLKLQNNRITSIGRHAFSRLRSVRNLFLDGNYIRHINPDAFYGLYNLELLYIHNNNLETIAPPVFQYFSPELMQIKLQNNPWVCNCSLRWLKHWLTNSSEKYDLVWRSENFEPTCELPRFLNRQKFSEVRGSDFACQIIARSSGVNKVLTIGEDVDLHCKYFSDPPVSAVWMKDGHVIATTDGNSKYRSSDNGMMTIKESTLKIKNFEDSDMGIYKCHAENIRGSDEQKFILTIEGVSPDEIPGVMPLAKREETDHTENAIIAAAVIGAIVFLIVIVIAVICLTKQVQEKHRRHKQEMKIKLQDHLKTNGYMSESHESPYDTYSPQSVRSQNEPREAEPLYDEPPEPTQLQTSSPKPHGSTYISFEPEDISNIIYSPVSKPQSQCSNTESTSPLLDRYSPAPQRYSPMPQRYSPLPESYTPVLDDDSPDLLYDTYLAEDYSIHDAPKSRSPRVTDVHSADPSLRLTPNSLTSSSPRMTPSSFEPVQVNPYDPHRVNPYDSQSAVNPYDSRSRLTPVYGDPRQIRSSANSPYRSLNHYQTAPRTQNHMSPYRDWSDDFAHSNPIPRKYSNGTLPNPYSSARLNSTGASSSSSRPSTPKSLSVSYLGPAPKKPPRYSTRDVREARDIPQSHSPTEEFAKYQLSLPRYKYPEETSTTPV